MDASINYDQYVDMLVVKLCLHKQIKKKYERIPKEINKTKQQQQQQQQQQQTEIKTKTSNTRLISVLYMHQSLFFNLEKRYC
jgi:uncharacterized Zn finger protein